MEEADYRSLASAYDTWNNHVEISYTIDKDLKEFVKDIFSSYDLWNPFTDEPDLHGYRLLIYNRC
jgi:hypothetical protein